MDAGRLPQVYEVVSGLSRPGAGKCMIFPQFIRQTKKIFYLFCMLLLVDNYGNIAGMGKTNLPFPVLEEK